MEKGCDAEASSVRPQWGYEPSVRSIRIVPAPYELPGHRGHPYDIHEWSRLLR
jgi:hypothetical protein